jgi:Tfp pilus assembly protein PilF
MAEEMESAYQRSAADQKKFDAAMKAMDQGDFKKAHTAFKKYTEEVPDDAEGWFCRAECGNYASGMFGAKVKDEDIIAAYTKAMELDETNAQYFQAYGLFCISIGKYDEAETAYNEAAQIDESLSASLYSEFAIEYYDHVLGSYGEILDDPKARAKYAKKALDYMLKALDMSEEEAKSLLN